MFAMLSAVLAVGEVSFVSSEDSDRVNVVGRDQVDTAAHLLGVHSEDLIRCMTCLLNETRGETVTIHYSLYKAEGLSVYKHEFRIVRITNSSLI